MNFDFSEDQKMLKDQVRRFLDDKSPLSVARQVLEGEKDFAEEVWQGLCELGVAGAAIPEEYGGLGLSALELCVVAEEIGRHVSAVPFSSSVYLAAQALLRAGSEAQKKLWLPKIASGEIIATLAVSEGAHMAGPKNLKTEFDGTVLSGEKLPVPDGGIAGLVIVVCRTAKGVSLALVDMNKQNVTVKPVETIDPTRQHVALQFDRTPAERLGEDGDGWDIFRAVENAAAVLFAFEQIGGTEATLEMATEYAKGRYAFGRPIGSYQAIKHKLADMYVKLELARSNAYYGAMMLADNGADLELAAATARVSASDAYSYAAKENIQTHGGMGYTWEADTQFHYRRSKLLELNLGGPSRWKERIVTQLEQKNSA